MRDSIKKIIGKVVNKKNTALFLAGALACSGFALHNIKMSKADETDNAKKYERATHLEVGTNGDLEVTRNELGNEPMGAKDSWTLFVYMCGSDLESGGGAATNDIKEMLAANSSSSVNIIIQTGGACEWQEFGISNDSIERYRVDKDSLELIEKLPNASMADSKTLADFISWGVEAYPAEHMGVIYWNHGGGSIYGACSDENYEGMLTLSEFDKAMANGTKNMTDKFDFIGFDACLMATIECANIFAPYADYMIASEESESSEGWSYEPLVNKMVENPDIDVVTLGKTIIDGFLASNIENGSDEVATLSMTDLSKIDGIIKEFNKVAKKMYEMSDTKENMTIFTRLAHAAENYSEGYGFDMIDFTDYMLNIADLIPEAENVAKLMEDAVVYEKHGETFMDTKGLSFYYCYGNMTFSDMNILRNITISPYLMNYIEKVAYGTQNYGSLEGFESSNWESNEYYFEDNYDFVEYEFQDTDDYINKLRSEDYFAKVSFDDKWYSWFEGEQSDRGEQEDVDVEVDEDLSSKLVIKDNKVQNTLTNKDLSNVAKGSYKVIIDNKDSMDVFGTIGTIDEDTVFNGKWFALSDGSLIEANKVNEGNGLTLYTSLVLMNDKETYILFVADKKNNVLVLGTNGAMDKNNKSASRFVAGIDKSAKIKPIYTTIDYVSGEVNQKYGNEVVANGKVIKSVDIDNLSVVLETKDAFGQSKYSMPSTSK